jgi:hypothetical protein
MRRSRIKIILLVVLLAVGFFVLKLCMPPSIQSRVTLRWNSLTNGEYSLQLHNGLDRETLYYESRRIQIKTGDEWKRYFDPEEISLIMDSFPIPLQPGRTVNISIPRVPKNNGPWRVEVELMREPSQSRFHLSRLLENLGLRQKLQTIRIWSDPTNTGQAHTSPK